MSKKKPHFVRRLSVFLGVLAASKLKVSRHKKKILAGRLGLDPLITKSCKTCQINKKRSVKYGHLPSKIVLSVPWEDLCVDLISPYTLKGKDGSSIDFMALTMIDPASSWLEVVELPTITRVTTKKVNGTERTIEEKNLR